MTANERLRRNILNEIDQLYAAGYQPLPRRGDQVERWLKARRDSRQERDSIWWYLDDMLDDYRLHADTGTPLDQHCCENGTVDDCHGCHDTNGRP